MPFLAAGAILAADALGCDAEIGHGRNAPIHRASFDGAKPAHDWLRSARVATLRSRDKIMDDLSRR
ncbi:MAG: hypothetical protein KGS44_04820 [Alphaproteobacteria bacterium]|nr:hypothetical protein [Alphaproteobacteria bacterium]